MESKLRDLVIKGQWDEIASLLTNQPNLQVNGQFLVHAMLAGRYKVLANLMPRVPSVSTNIQHLHMDEKDIAEPTEEDEKALKEVGVTISLQTRKFKTWIMEFIEAVYIRFYKVPMDVVTYQLAIRFANQRVKENDSLNELWAEDFLSLVQILLDLDSNQLVKSTEAANGNYILCTALFLQHDTKLNIPITAALLREVYSFLRFHEIAKSPESWNHVVTFFQNKALPQGEEDKITFGRRSPREAELQLSLIKHEVSPSILLKWLGCEWLETIGVDTALAILQFGSKRKLLFNLTQEETKSMAHILLYDYGLEKQVSKRNELYDLFLDGIECKGSLSWFDFVKVNGMKRSQDLQAKFTQDEEFVLPQRFRNWIDWDLPLPSNFNVESTHIWLSSLNVGGKDYATYRGFDRDKMPEVKIDLDVRHVTTWNDLEEFLESANKMDMLFSSPTACYFKLAKRKKTFYHDQQDCFILALDEKDQQVYIYDPDYPYRKRLVTHHGLPEFLTRIRLENALWRKTCSFNSTGRPDDQEQAYLDKMREALIR
jgi:hypothetical protein